MSILVKQSAIRWAALLLVTFACSSASAASSPAWKPERQLGSAQLSAHSVQWIVVPEAYGAKLSKSLDDLTTVLEAKGGAATLWESTDDPLPKQALIFEIDEARTSGFAIRVERTRLYVYANSAKGFQSAIYEICRKLGARWYWGGDIGLTFLESRNAWLPRRLNGPKAAFVQRTLYPVGSDFGRRNGLAGKYSFNHNLSRIFDREAFETYPEAFAEIGGRVRPPSKSPKYDAQPDFTEPKAVELAVEAVRTHFSENPEANSFSLSINDNSLYDESVATEVVMTKGGSVTYFRERPNYTDLVFGFTNAVAEQVFKDPDMLQTPQGEDRYVTALAYYTTEQSPSFALHPRVMPVLTSDRAQWHDPVYRAEDKALIERWAHSGAERIATWDYYFGAPYPYPRQFNQWIGESIPYLYEAGVDVFFSQLPSVWGLDGPKAWLTANLLRDPKQNPEALLNEFYTNFFGPVADPIRNFYELAEQRRNENEGPANWIKFYKDEAGIELFDPDTIRQMRGYITDASDHLQKCGVKDCLYLQRVEVVSEAFSYTEAYARFHRSRNALTHLALAALGDDSHEKDGAALVHALEEYQDRKAAFLELSKVITQKPMHRALSQFNKVMQSDPLPLALGALAKTSASSTNIGSENHEGIASLIAAVRSKSSPRNNLVNNPALMAGSWEKRNFLGPEIPTFNGWKIQYRASEHLRLTTAASGDSGIRVSGADIVALSQRIPIAPGNYYILEMDAEWRVSPDNRTRVQLNWKDTEGSSLGKKIIMRLPNGTSSGTQALRFALKAPQNAHELNLGVIANRQAKNDFIEITRIALSDVDSSSAIAP